MFESAWGLVFAVILSKKRRSPRFLYGFFAEQTNLPYFYAVKNAYCAAYKTAIS